MAKRSRALQFVVSEDLEEWVKEQAARKDRTVSAWLKGLLQELREKGSVHNERA